jgi:hypothetical protein
VTATDVRSKGATYRLVMYRRPPPADGLKGLLADATDAGVTAYYARFVPADDGWVEKTTDPSEAVVLHRDDALAALKRLGSNVWGLEPVEAP